MLKPVLAFLLPLAVFALPPLAEELGQWESFVATYQKTYATKVEEAKRFGIFVENLKLAKERAAKEQGTATFGVNKFSDLTEEEFRKTSLMDRKVMAKKVPRNVQPAPESAYQLDLPAHFDWRDYHAVSAVKDQGQCGGCWAFSTTGNVESVNAVVNGKLFSLSEQELMDCSVSNDGCDGGMAIDAMSDLRRLGGLENETTYPYEAENDKCRFKKSEVVININGAVTLSKDETKIAAYLIKHGAISVDFNAANSLNGYQSGIVNLSHKECNPADHDHAVLLVGFGTENGMPYWIIKNSWGATWGENGYFRMYRGNNTCGIANNAVSAIIAKH